MIIKDSRTVAEAMRMLHNAVGHLRQSGEPFAEWALGLGTSGRSVLSVRWVCT